MLQTDANRRLQHKYNFFTPWLEAYDKKERFIICVKMKCKCDTVSRQNLAFSSSLVTLTLNILTCIMRVILSLMILNIFDRFLYKWWLNGPYTNFHILIRLLTLMCDLDLCHKALNFARYTPPHNGKHVCQFILKTLNACRMFAPGKYF